MPTKFKLTQAANRERAKEVFTLLDQEYPDAKCSLDHVDPLQLLVSTILSAQCTDERVNKVTPALFERFKTPEDYVNDPATLERMIKTCGFYRNKTKNIVAACRSMMDRHGGAVPGTLDELVALAGVGRKTANVILGTCFDTPGVVVDTHCGRIARRLGFTRNTDPAKVEQDLMKIWNPPDWSIFSHFMVFHGRAICQSRAPQCSRCPLRERCPFPETREGKKIAQ
ncbi:MAG: endonuclease III [Candidatus Hydrogenedentes bacterium]|nr:endonuclease III [Candidatus Hydrogenedentota bacterium]